MDVEQLDRIVRRMHDDGALHRKGFRLNECSTDTASLHLIDELVELRQAQTYRAITAAVPAAGITSDPTDKG